MTPAQDPFYIVKEEIQESEETPSNTGEWVHLSKELVASCESLEWQMDELDKTIAVAARDPAWYGLDERELEKRKRWTKTAHTQVDTIRKTIEVGTKKSNLISSGRNGLRQELMHLPNDIAAQTGRSNPYHDNDEFISSESDRQMLLIRQQDEELDELSASVQRIGGVGLTIHEELIGQIELNNVANVVPFCFVNTDDEKILEDLSMEMETTSNQLDFVQKRVAMVMKKAGAKGQFMMMAFLLVLSIILFVLVFFT